MSFFSGTVDIVNRTWWAEESFEKHEGGAKVQQGGDGVDMWAGKCLVFFPVCF